MRKVKFFLRADYGDPQEEIMEYPDGATDEEVQEEFNDWVFNQIDSAWLDVTNGED